MDSKLFVLYPWCGQKWNYGIIGGMKRTQVKAKQNIGGGVEGNYGE